MRFGMVFYPVNTFLSRKVKRGVRKVEETKLAALLYSYWDIYRYYRTTVFLLLLCNYWSSLS